MRFLLFCLSVLSGIPLLAQSECIKLSSTSFHEGEGMCYFPDSDGVIHRTAKAYVTNNCSKTVWVSLDYDGKMHGPYLSGSPTRQRIMPGERVEYRACNVPPNEGRWILKKVEYEGGESSASGGSESGSRGSNTGGGAGNSGSNPNNQGTQGSSGSGGSSGSSTSTYEQRQREAAAKRQRDAEAQRLSQAAAKGLGDAIDEGFLSGIEGFASFRSGPENGEFLLAENASYHLGFEIMGKGGWHVGYAFVDDWIYDSGGGGIFFTGVNVDLYTLETDNIPWITFGIGGEFGMGDAEWQDEDILTNQIETIREDGLLYGGHLYAKVFQYIYVDYGIGQITGNRSESNGQDFDNYSEMTSKWSFGLSIPF